jgi:succinoglycan biosynthesis transport protein ExoP
LSFQLPLHPAFGNFMSQANNKSLDHDSNPSSNSNVNNTPSRNGGLLVHPATPNVGPRLPLLQPYPAAPASPDSKAILNALRRKWFPALFLGLLFGFCGGATAWHLVPAPYTAYRELLIRSVPARIIFKTSEPESDFKTYKSTHLRLAKSPLVLNAALSKPELQKLSLIQKVQKTMRPRIWLEKNLEVTSPAEEFIRISLSGEEPEGLAEIVNAVADSYYKEIVDVEKNRRKLRLNELKSILGEHDSKLSTKRKNLNTLAEFLNTTDSETISLKQQMDIEYYGQLRRQLIQVRIDLSLARSQLVVKKTENKQSEEKTDSQNTNYFDKSPNNNEPLIERYIDQHQEFIEEEQRIQRLEAKIDLYEQRFEEKNFPKLVDLKKELKTRETGLEELRKELRIVVVEDLRKQMEDKRGISDLALKQKIQSLEGLKTYLDAELEKQKEREQNTGQKSIQLESIQKQIAQDEKVADIITEEIIQIEIELKTKDRIERLNIAETPVERDTGRKYMLTAFSGIGMFSLFFVGIVWIELGRGRISGIEEVAGNLNLRVIGSLPHIPRSAINGAGRRSRDRNKDWQRKLSESIDSTRTMLLKEADRETLKLVMITSALPSEGKTTLSSHLATSLVRAGRKVLLIDCDLRWPGIHSVFNNSLTPGLCERLRGEADLDEVIRPSSQDGLWILPAGDVNEKVYQILAQGGIASIFQQAKQEFDFVIVDSAPVLPVTDTLMIAQHADAVLFSIRRDVSQGTKVAAAMDRMERLGIPVLGSVVIGLEKELYGAAYPYYGQSMSR